MSSTTMSTTTKANTEAEKARAVLMAFAQHGFKKTSMECIGQAANVSRQSIYKKFGSKEACYKWVIHAYLHNVYTRIFTAMESGDEQPLETLLTVMDIMIGESVEISNNPHGAELFDDALKISNTSQEDWPLRLRARMASFLVRNNLASEETAEGVAFAIISAGKGLLLQEDSREQFLKDIRLIINSVVIQHK